MTIVIAILALSFLIIVHELGHFTVAKLSGIKVHEFALFMGPKIFEIKKGETTYTLRLVPIGGYVRMEGEEQASEDSRAYNKKPIPVRMAVIAAGPIMNLIVAILLVFIITSVNGFNTTKVDQLQNTSPAYQAGIRQGDEVLKFNGKRIFNPMDVDLFLYGSKGQPANIQVQRGRTKLTYKLYPEVYPQNRYILGFGANGSYGEGSNIVSSIATDSAAYKSGLRQNDRIIKLGGKTVSDGKAIRDFLKVNKGAKVNVTVLRNGNEKTLQIVPQMDKTQEQYSSGMSFIHEKAGVFETLKQSAEYSYSVARTVIYSLSWLITGRVSLNEMSGPVGIVSAIGSVVQYSPTFMDKLFNLMNFTALISVNLGLFNLIPFPALDGSKLILLTIEAVRRKALPPEREAVISLVGLVLLVMLMIFTTYNDILRMAGKG